jgi:hypothetical protein
LNDLEFPVVVDKGEKLRIEPNKQTINQKLMCFTKFDANAGKFTTL